MPTEISGRNYDVSPKIRDLITSKLSKVEERLFDDVIDARVVLDVQKYRNICEILIVGKSVADIAAAWKLPPVETAGLTLKDVPDLRERVRRMIQEARNGLLIIRPRLIPERPPEHRIRRADNPCDHEHGPARGFRD